MAATSASRKSSTLSALTVLVIDASVLVVALTDAGAAGERARARLRGERLAAPDLADLEVVSVLRRLVQAGHLSVRQAEDGIEDLSDLPLERVAHHALLHRCWQLRGTLTPYDAAYVAVAEALGAPLLTWDLRLAHAPGPRCEIEVLEATSAG